MRHSTQVSLGAGSPGHMMDRDRRGGGGRGHQQRDGSDESDDDDDGGSTAPLNI